jgi:hypothetical protein
MEAVKTKKYRGYSIEVFYDESPENPLKEFDFLGTFSTFTCKYDLSSKDNPFKTPEELQAFFDKEKPIYIPIYIYDHSGITINTIGFSFIWDSAKIGYIWVDRKKVLGDYNKKKLSKSLIETVKKVLKTEVEQVDQWLKGEVYGYQIKDEDGEEVDSCWGYWDTPNQIIENCKEVVDILVKLQPAKKSLFREAVKKLNIVKTNLGIPFDHNTSIILTSGGNNEKNLVNAMMKLQEVINLLEEIK